MTQRALSLLLVATVAFACTTAPITPTPTAFEPSPTAASTASPTATPGRSPTPAPSTAAPTASATAVDLDAITIDLEATDGSGVAGTLTATDTGDGTTTLAAAVSSVEIHPWSLHPGFGCVGSPAEDSQLSVALPDIEQGSTSEVVDSANFGTPLAAVVFSAPTTGVVFACGLLPALDWATTAPPTASATNDAQVPPEIGVLVDQLETAVDSGDSDAYLALVDEDDPVFAVEHSRWVDDWVANPPEAYDLSVSDVSVDGSNATGLLTVRWSAGGQIEREAELPVEFTQSADGTWLYSGEAWQTEELDRFRLRLLPGVDVDPADISTDLPAVYSHVTDSLGYEPSGRMEIKVYPDGPSLVSTVQLGLPDIHGWNEPGEALKVRLDPLILSLTPTIAHEFTHFAVFDRAGTQRPRMPWWLEEGLATYVAEEFAAPGVGDERLAEVQAWARDGALAEWPDLADFNTTPQELWPYVYAQGYAMVRYITETYGPDARNEWLEQMSTEMDIAAATESVLDDSFDDLAADFEDWLLT